MTSTPSNGSTGCTPHGAIISAVFARQLIGFLWYSPVLFLNPWLQSQGRPVEALGSGADLVEPLVVDIVASLVIAYGLAGILRPLGVRSFRKGAIGGAMLAAFYSLTVMATHYRFLKLGWPVIAIDGVKELLCISLAGGLIGRALSKLNGTRSP